VPFSVGDRFAGYTIRGALGSGGMGEVYLAQHPRLPRLDAIKILPPELTTDGDYRERFNREADLASGLWHPHIVGVHDRGEYEGQLWISMDFVEGTDASRLLENCSKGLPLDETLDIIEAVADALDFAHQRRLIHRDVKPANILLTALGATKRRILLADFGIARTADDISGLTATNMALGTINYAAPEQLMGESIDGRADQYALAATTYHLLTGAQLFAHSNAAVVISKHLNAEPPGLAASRPELARLDEALDRALSKNPQARFQNCIAFANAMRTSSRQEKSGHTPSTTNRTSSNNSAALATSSSAAQTQQAPAQDLGDPTQVAPRPAAVLNKPATSTKQKQALAAVQSRRLRTREIVIASVSIAAVAIAALIAFAAWPRDRQPPSAAPSPTMITPTTTIPFTPKTSLTASPTTTSRVGAFTTIADYIKENRITETPVKRGDPGTPTLDLPVPAGWEDAGSRTPDYAWGAIVSTDPTMASDPPSIVELMSKLTGNVDPAKVLEYAPGELKNLPGFEGGDGNTSTLGGFDAYQIGGSYVKDGAKRMIAQKTVVIPSKGDVFVLQLNADGTEDQMGPLMDATSQIDEKTTITP
jgi:serine/threonine-protein kinase